MFDELRQLLSLTRSQHIARRYFVVNGFDGALTMLGLLVGFYVSDQVELPVIISACLGAAVALGVSGVSSAYVSEAAEKQRELQKLEAAMVKDLGESAYGRATRLLPLVIGLVNGMAPLLISLLIIMPLWAATWLDNLPAGPLEAAFGIALGIIFLLGVFLGRIAGVFWLWAGLRTLLIAAVTAILVMLIAPPPTQ